MSRNKRHIHRYQRRYIGTGKRYQVYHCNLPDCSHYLPKDLVKGKLSICNRCGETMLMGPLQLSLAKPHCMGCVRPKEENKLGRIKEIVEAMDRDIKEIEALEPVQEIE